MESFRRISRTAALLVGAMDSARLEIHGGYPSQWQVLGDNLIIATVDDEGGPVLEVIPTELIESLREKMKMYPESKIIELWHEEIYDENICIERCS